MNQGMLNIPNLFPTVVASESATSAPLPTTTEPVLPTQTESVPLPLASPLPSPTALILPSETPTAIPTPFVTVAAEPTVKYPEGNRYTLYYNETSFFMLNRSYGWRSISGFVFQRLDNEGLPMKDIFQGYQWETRDFDYLPRNFCVNITIYGDQDPPYLSPAECGPGIMSTIQPRFDRPGEILFWTPKEGSSQFRVLWLDEEIARCDISSNACDIFIP